MSEGGDTCQLILMIGWGKAVYLAYKDHLDGDYSPDYWSDCGIDLAVGILFDFSTDDWRCLAENWPSNDGVWKVRCAETLGDSIDKQRLLILLSMLDDPESFVAAADSLRSWPKGSFGPHDINVERLISLSGSLNKIDNAVLSDFIDRVKAS